MLRPLDYLTVSPIKCTCTDCVYGKKILCSDIPLFVVWITCAAVPAAQMSRTDTPPTKAHEVAIHVEWALKP